MTTSAPADLAARVRELRWYHSIDLPGGTVTPGWFDTRPTAGKVPLPGDLRGRRCLDVGTWDGFWAFEMERRGADEVVAIDVEDPARWDWPPHVTMFDDDGRRQYLEEFKQGGAAFRLAHEALGSAVDRRDVSVYELDPAVHGTFDLVFLGSLLLHLRDPVRALAALRSVCAGEAVIADTIDLLPTLLRPRTPSVRLEGIGRPWWWIPNRAAFLQMLRSAGFEILETTSVYLLPLGEAHPRTPWRTSLKLLRTAAGREDAIIGRRGIPHVAARVRPLPDDGRPIATAR